MHPPSPPQNTEEKGPSTDPKSSCGLGVLWPSHPKLPSTHTRGEGAGFAHDEPLKVWDLASLSSLELITLIDMFVYSGIYFVVLFFLRLCYFLEPEQCGCWQRVGKGADPQGVATSSCRAGLGPERLLYQRPKDFYTKPQTLLQQTHLNLFSTELLFQSAPSLFKRINSLLVTQP